MTPTDGFGFFEMSSNLLPQEESATNVIRALRAKRRDVPSSVTQAHEICVEEEMVFKSRTTPPNRLSTPQAKEKVSKITSPAHGHEMDEEELKFYQRILQEPPKPLMSLPRTVWESDSDDELSDCVDLEPPFLEDDIDDKAILLADFDDLHLLEDEDREEPSLLSPEPAKNWKLFRLKPAPTPEMIDVLFSEVSKVPTMNKSGQKSSDDDILSSDDNDDDDDPDHFEVWRQSWPLKNDLETTNAYPSDDDGTMVHETSIKKPFHGLGAKAPPQRRRSQRSRPESQQPRTTQQKSRRRYSDHATEPTDINQRRAMTVLTTGWEGQAQILEVNPGQRLRVRASRLRKKTLNGVP